MNVLISKSCDAKQELRSAHAPVSPPAPPGTSTRSANKRLSANEPKLQYAKASASLTQGPAAHALRPMHPCARSEARACRCAAAASFRQPAHPGHLHARRTALRRPRLPLLRLPFRGCLVCIWARTPACVRARSTSPPPQAHSLRQVPQNSALPANDLGPPPLPGSACVRGAPTSLVRGPRVTSCPPSPLRSAHRPQGGPSTDVTLTPHLNFEGQVWYPSTHHVNFTRNENRKCISKSNSDFLKYNPCKTPKPVGV